MRKAFSRLATVFLYLVSLLPFRVLYLLSDLIFLILFYIIRYRRTVVAANLHKAFPQKNDSEISIIERKFYRHFADLLVEGIKLVSISRREVLKRFEVKNPELFEQFYEQGKSVLGVVGHYGNWELGALAGTLITKRTNLIIYKPLHSAVFDQFFLRLRSRFGGVPVAMKSILRMLAVYRHEPTLTIFAGDQTPVREETQYFTEFLHQPTAIYLGVEKIARSTGYPVCFIDIRKPRRGHYTCTFVLLENDPKSAPEYALTEKHVRYLENVINDEPQYWLWSHRRWKFTPEGMTA